MPRTMLPKGSVPVTFRLPREIQKLLLKKARSEQVSFSELVRRALGREVRSATPARKKPRPRTAGAKR